MVGAEGLVCSNYLKVLTYKPRVSDIVRSKLGKDSMDISCGRVSIFDLRY